MTRSSGIVLHISSLPNPYGIGTFGECAHDFAAFLKKAGQKYWQILPLNPTGYGDSPYQSCSTRAINPYFIDLDFLRRDGLLDFDDYAYVNFGQNQDRVDYGELYSARYKVLRAAYDRGRKPLAAKIDAFREENADWLPDFALFMAVKSHFDMAALAKWPDADIRARKPAALAKYRKLLADEVLFQEFMQYLAYSQWEKLKAHANGLGIKIIGDIPIYCAEDSVELWSSPGLFKLKKDGTPSVVAGCPPDLYSPTGQLWGNPIYDWKAHEKSGFKWWIDRVNHTKKFYDAVRIDHFRGFEAYWEVPAGDKDASGGKWTKGPAMKFVDAINAGVPDATLIAEDLGTLDDVCVKFIKDSGYPGMKLIVDAFDPDGDSDFLPHNVPKNCVFYISTHDSPTFADFYFNHANERQRSFAFDYLRLNDREGYSWGALKTVWASAANLAMATMTDVLGLGADARMNTPGVASGNWDWRVRRDAINDHVAWLLKKITDTYRRGEKITEEDKKS